MNADEAKKCFDIAKEAVKIKNFDKAKKFLEKSIKLYETDEAQVLLQRLDFLKNQTNNEPAAPPYQTTQTKKTQNVETNQPIKDERKFSEDDAKICREIIARKDYYSVLGVSKDCTEAELKKAFKKMAIKVHPDKNPHPKATDAFKKVNAAMACLSDPDKRRVYDQVGNEQAYEQREQRGGGNGFGPGEFVTPEDLFNHFFYGTDLPRGNQQQRQPRQHHQEIGPQVLLRQFGPLLFMLFLSLIMNWMSSVIQPATQVKYNWQFEPSYTFPEKQSTYRLGQVYYVSPYTSMDFRKDKNLKQTTDQEVEEKILYRLEQHCSEAKRKRENFIAHSKRYSEQSQESKKFQKAANDVKMDYCIRLQADRKTIEQFGS